MSDWFECSDAAARIVSMGGQIPWPLKLGDAQVTYSSRWSLARAIDEAVEAERAACEAVTRDLYHECETVAGRNVARAAMARIRDRRAR